MPNLELNINSNFGVKPILVERLSNQVNRLIEQNKIKSFKIFTSLDTWGPKAEYIRYGLDLDVWEKNFNTYLTTTNLPITFMVTFNILTVSNFKTLLEKFLEWREKYNRLNQTRWQRILFDTPYLKEPLQYDMNILPKDEYMSYMYDTLRFIEENLNDHSSSKFSQIEYEKFLRITKYMETTTYDDERINQGRKDFYNFFNELDKRRNTDLLNTFPEMSDFYYLCKQLND